MKPRLRQLRYIVHVAASVGLQGDALADWLERFGVRDGVGSIASAETARKVIGGLRGMRRTRDPAVENAIRHGLKRPFTTSTRSAKLSGPVDVGASVRP